MQINFFILLCYDYNAVKLFMVYCQEDNVIQVWICRLLMTTNSRPLPEDHIHQRFHAGETKPFLSDDYNNLRMYDTWQL